MSDFFKPEDFACTKPDWFGRDFAGLANRILAERGTVVYGRVDGDFGWFDTERKYGHHLNSSPIMASNTALLVNIQPIEQDSADKIIRDLVSYDSSGSPEWLRIIERAKKLTNGR